MGARGAWSRRALSGLLVTATLLSLFPVLCDSWWWGAKAGDELKEEKQDAVTEALKAAEEAANQSKAALEMVISADLNASAAENAAEKAEAKLTGTLASIFGVSEADRANAEQLRTVAQEKRSQVTTAQQAAERASNLANQTRQRAEFAQNASITASERQQAEKQLNSSMQSARNRQSVFERVSARLQALRANAAKAQEEVIEVSNQAKAAKVEANDVKREVELLREELKTSVRNDVQDDEGNSTSKSTENIKRRLSDAMDKREKTALNARQAQERFLKAAAKAKELDTEVAALNKEVMKHKVDALESQRSVEAAQNEISLKRAKEDESRARMEMTVLEGKLLETAAALSTLEKAREQQLSEEAEKQLEAARILHQDSRWKEIQEQQVGSERVLRTKMEEHQNRTEAEKAEFERLLLNKTDAERLLLLAEHNRTEAERQRIEQENLQLQEEYRAAVEKFKTSEEARLKAELLQNTTEVERLRVERERNETATKLQETAAQKEQLEANKTKVEQDLESTIAALKEQNKTAEAEREALNRSITALQEDGERLKQNLSSQLKNLTQLEREHRDTVEEMEGMQETIDSLRGFLPPAFIGPRRMVQGVYGAISSSLLSIWRTVVATLLLLIVCAPFVKKLSESENLMDRVLDDIGVDLHVVVGLGWCFWFGAWSWGFSWIIVACLLSVSHFQARRDKLARNASRIAHPTGLKEKKAEDRAHPNYVIQLTVKSAQFYFAQDSGSVGDPYVTVEFGSNEAVKTETVMNSMKPEWNKMFEFESDDVSTRIKVNVWDWDRLSRDDFIGSFTLYLSDVVRTSQPYAKGHPAPFPFRKVEGATKKGHVNLEWTWRYKFQDPNQQLPWYEKSLLVSRALGSSRDPAVNLICKDAAEAEAFLRVMRVCAPGVISAVEGLVATLQPYAFPYQNLHVVLAAVGAYALGSLGLDVAFVLPLAMLVHTAEVCYTSSMYRKHWQKLLPLMDPRVRALELWQKEYVHEKSRVAPEHLWDVFQRIRSDLPHCLAQHDTNWLNGFLRLFWDIYRPWLSAYLHSLITYFASSFATVEEVFPGRTAPQLMNIVGVNGSYADVPNHRDKLEVSLQEVAGFTDTNKTHSAYAIISILSDAGEIVKHETEVAVGSEGSLVWTTDSCVLMVDPKNMLTEKLVIRIYEGHPDDESPPTAASCSASVIILMEKLIEHCPEIEKKWDGTAEKFEETYQVERYSKLNTLRPRVKFSLERSAKEKTTMENMGNIYVLDADIVWDTDLFVKLSVVGMTITVNIKRLMLPARLVLEWCHPVRDLGQVPTLDKFDGDFKEFARAFNTAAVFPNLNRLWLALRHKPELDEKIELPVSKSLLKAPGIKQLLGENFLVDIVYSVFPLNIFGGAAYVNTLYSDQLTDLLDISKSEGITRQGKLRLHVLRVSIDDNFKQEMEKCNWYCVVHYGSLDVQSEKPAGDAAAQKKVVDIDMDVEGNYRNTQIKFGTRRPCFNGRFEFDVMKPKKEAVCFQVYLREGKGCDQLIMNKIMPMTEFIDNHMMVPDSFPQKLKLWADSCKIEVLADITTIESSESNFDMPALEESTQGLEKYNLRRRSDGTVQNFNSMLQSVGSLRNHKAAKVNDQLYRAYSSLLREGSKDVGWEGLGGEDSLRGLDDTLVQVSGMPGTLAVKITKLHQLPKWALPKGHSDVELELSLLEDGRVVDVRTETWASLVKSKTFDEADEEKPKSEMVARRSIFFAFEVPKACISHSLRLQLKHQSSRTSQEELVCPDWKLGRLVSPGDGSFVSSFREKSMGLVTDKGIDLPLFPPSEVGGISREGSEEETPQDRRGPSITASLSFLPWDAAAEPCVLVTVHKAKDLPWVHGFIPPDSYCRMNSEFRLRDPTLKLTSLKYPDDAQHACPSSLPHIDRDQRGQAKTSSTVPQELHPAYEKKFLFYVNREMLDSRHFKEQTLVLRIYQEAYDAQDRRMPPKEVGYHAVSVRKLYLEHVAARRKERVAAEAAAAAAKAEGKEDPVPSANPGIAKTLWYIREDSESTNMEGAAAETARGPPYSSVQVSMSFLGDWSHVNEEADEELDDKMLKYQQEQREKLLKEQEAKLAKEGVK